MTTIAYRDHVFAADTQTTAGSSIFGRSIKIGLINGLFFCASGNAAWGGQFRDWVKSGAKGNHPLILESMQHTGGDIILPNGDVIAFHKHGVERRQDMPYWADGSGCDYAMGAMHAGADAIQAVEAAIAWDIYTSAPITVLRREA